jgi:hypothetical protein
MAATFLHITWATKIFVLPCNQNRIYFLEKMAPEPVLRIKLYRIRIQAHGFVEQKIEKNYSWRQKFYHLLQQLSSKTSAKFGPFLLFRIRLRIRNTSWQPCGWYLFVNGPDVLLKVGLLRVDLLADVAGGGGELHPTQVRQLDVLGQVAELLAAVRAQRRFGPFAALASPLFSGQEGMGRLVRFFLQLALISKRENDDKESKNSEKYSMVDQ